VLSVSVLGSTLKRQNLCVRFSGICTWSCGRMTMDVRRRWQDTCKAFLWPPMEGFFIGPLGKVLLAPMTTTLAARVSSQSTEKIPYARLMCLWEFRNGLPFSIFSDFQSGSKY